MKNIKAILFDLDGTITDPKEGIINSFKHSLTKMEIPESSYEVLKSFIGPPLHHSFMNTYNLNKEETDRAVDFFREYFRDKGIFENKVFEGLEDILKLLKKNNYKIALATSKPQIFAEKILNHFNLTKYFDFIQGSNLDGSMTDKEEIITSVLSSLKIQGDEALMIGDRKFDIIGAKKCKTKSCAVTYGYGSIEEINHEKPDYICSSMSELNGLLSRCFTD